MIRVRCRHCGRRFGIRAEDAGKKGYCPNTDCRQPFRAPADPGAALPTPAALQKTKPSRKSSAAPVKGRSTSAKNKKRSKSAASSYYTLWGISSLAAFLVLGLAFFLLRPGDDSLAPANSLDAAEQLEPVAHLDFSKDVQPFFKQYCTDCHGTDFQEGDFSFDRYANAESIKHDRAIWTKVLHLMQLEAMPPPESDQPSKEERQDIANWIDHQLFYVNCAVPHDPGRVTTRRLNRNEYNNTIRDLLAIDFHPADDFPSDDVGYGFDNIGDVLSVPPLLIEKYLAAAEQVADKAIPTRHPEYFKKRFQGKVLKEEGAVSSQGNGTKAIVSRGRVYGQVKFPERGTYLLRIDAQADQAGDELAKMELRLDKEVLKTIEINGHKKLNSIEYQFQSLAGNHDVSAGFLNDFYDEKAKDRKDRNLFVEFIQVEGPLELPESLRKSHPLLRVSPENGVSVGHAAQSNFREFLPRAFRRPVSEEEITKYAGLVEMAAERGVSFEQATQVALQAMLISPHFLFRIEDERQQLADREQLDDFALASRLSYFLWSSMPDDELFELAQSNQLHQPEVLKSQTERMLNDPKVDALVANFAGQWLGLRKLTTNEVAPNPELFPEFNEKLRRDMWQETELFFGSVVKENRSIYDLLDGRYSFLNERLAKLYGISGIEGETFRQVNFEGDQRMGILTHPSILTLTSYPNRTSPVKRGQWVLENMLNDAPPDPPPNAPSIEQTQAVSPNLSFREQLELHRKDPGCAACHVTMDEIGFGLENFDAIGRWRTKEGEFEVNSTGTLPNGESFTGPHEMISVLGQRKTQFGRCLTEKLMTFALGRGVEFYDRCAIDRIMTDLEQDDRFATLVSGIVQSAPFQMRRESQ